MSNIPKDFLSLNEFADCIGIHYNTVRKMIKLGRLSAFRTGCGGITSPLKIPRSEIQRLCLVDLGHIVEDMVKKRIEDKDNKVKFRFLEKVEKTETCWLWNGAVTKSGYGVFSLNHKYIRAHRASYLIHNGDIPENMLVLHSCDVRRCVNPEHIHLGTPQQNINEMIERKRYNPPIGERGGNSKLKEKDVLLIRKMYSEGKRICDISIALNISYANVSDIARRKRWKHI